MMLTGVCKAICGWRVMTLRVAYRLNCNVRMIVREHSEVLKLRMASVHGGDGCLRAARFEREKGIRWMPWHQEAMKDVARCEKPWGAASRL